MEIPSDCETIWQSYTQEEREFVIRSGIQCVEHAKTVSMGEEQKKIKMDYEEQLQRLREKLRSSEIVKQQTIDHKEREYSSQLRLLQDRLNESQRSHRERVQQLQRQIEETESKSIRQAMDAVQDREERIQRPLLSQIETLKSQIGVLQRENQETRTHSQSLTMKLTEQMEKNQMYAKSTNRGAAGQMDIMTLLQKSVLADEGWGIIDTSTTGGMGDIQVVSPSGNSVESVLVEIKHYSHSIPKHEVVKFKRDVQQSDVGSGIFISLQTSIQGIKNRTVEILVDDSGGSKPVIYLVGKVERDVLPQWIWMMSRITSHMYQKMMASVDKQETIRVADVQMQIQSILDRVQPIQKQIQTLQSVFVDNVKLLEGTVMQLVQTITDVGSEYGMITVEPAQKGRRSKIDDKELIDAWRKAIGSQQFEGKAFFAFMRQREVGKTRATRLRSEYCRKITADDKEYAGTGKTIQYRLKSDC